jgi:DNA uptake protein ComE-like DNA-binding protein
MKIVQNQAGMPFIKNQLKSFFSFNKPQERGAFVLICLILLIMGVNYLLPVLLKEKQMDYSDSLAEIKEWQMQQKEITTPNAFSDTQAVFSKNAEAIMLKPFPFNPNTLSQKKWLEMGVPKNVVKTIANYVKKGGRFRKAEDLQKIYSMDADLYAQLEDFVVIPEEVKAKRDSFFSPSKEAKTAEIFFTLDLNKADSVDFLQIPGLGKFYAGKIVEYRKRLGGYVSLDQLTELYKVDNNRLRLWIPYLFIGDSSVQQIALNTADFKTILRHPYTGYETTKKIVNKRTKLGRYAGLYQLTADSLLSDSIFKRLKPYIKLD